MTIDVFASPQSRKSDRRVHVIWHGHVDRVNLIALFLQEVSPVLIATCAREAGGRLGHARGVDVADRCDINVGVGSGVGQVAPALAVDADGGVVELAVRGGIG